MRRPASRAARAAVAALVCAAAAVAPLRAEDTAEMVVIPATVFVMGSSDLHPDRREVVGKRDALRPYEVLLARAESAWGPADERPTHEVRLRSYAIDRDEVTNARYRRFLEAIRASGDHGRCHPDEPKGKDHTPRYWRDYNSLLADPVYRKTAPFTPASFNGDHTPVVGVDWYDAYAFAAWAGKRLPTEAEWELAARGTDGRRWPWGNTWAWGRANLGGEKRGADVWANGREKDGFIYPAPVGSFPDGRSPFGCTDMAGNAAEWCADWYAADAYAKAAVSGAASSGRPAVCDGPTGPETGETRIVRGGSSANLPSACRTTIRSAFEPEFRTFTLGFRCAKDR